MVLGRGAKPLATVVAVLAWSGVLTVGVVEAAPGADAHFTGDIVPEPLLPCCGQ